MTTREEDVDTIDSEESEVDDDSDQSSPSRFNWSLILSFISIVGVVALWVAMPADRSQDVDWLLESAIAQGDSLKTIADTVTVHEGRLDRHWDRMGDIENTMAVASKVDSALGVVRSDVAGLQKVAGRVKKLEGEAKQSLNLSKLTLEELELLKKTFGDHAALKAKDAHGNQKVASSSSSANGDDWEFVSRGGSK